MNAAASTAAKERIMSPLFWKAAFAFVALPGMFAFLIPLAVFTDWRPFRARAGAGLAR